MDSKQMNMSESGITGRPSGGWGIRSVLPIALLALAACNPFGPNIDEFVIRVDSISAPSTAVSTEPLTVTFHGGIGPDLCSSLKRVERTAGPRLLEVRFHGQRDARGRLCLQQPSILEHEETVAPPLEDPFTIRVLEPDGDTLEKVVRIGG
jgi:hypothetical protein